MKLVRKVECQEYYDEGNGKDERQCKKFGPAVVERPCKEYESVITDGGDYVRGNCKRYEGMETHVCDEYFESDASAVCIPKGRKCDGKVDCPNGRDEDITVCGMFSMLSSRYILPVKIGLYHLTNLMLIIIFNFRTSSNYSSNKTANMASSHVRISLESMGTDNSLVTLDTSYRVGTLVTSNRMDPLGINDLVTLGVNH